MHAPHLPPGRLSRREFARRLSIGLTAGATATGRSLGAPAAATSPASVGDTLLTFPGPWAFNLPKGSLILVSDDQLEQLQDPDREVDLSLSATPNRTTLSRLCADLQAQGARTLILAFDHFWAQYRAGQGSAPRRFLPDTVEYIERVAVLSRTLREHGLGFELSLLSPLELGAGYRQRTGDQGRWVQYREGLRDPQTGQYEVALWEHQRWTNNKGHFDLERAGVRVFAYRERRIGGTPYAVVHPSEIVELSTAPTLEAWQGTFARGGDSFTARRLTCRGRGDTGVGPLDRVLVVVAYRTPEMDYFSPKSAPFLHDLIDRYHAAGVPLNGLYADEMHIQQDWVYHNHHDEGQFTLRYLTPHLAAAFAAQYGAEFADLEKYLVYFCAGQHGFQPGLDARAQVQHVLGDTPDDIQRTVLLRRRYYELLSRTVVGLFAEAKAYAEQRYGHALEARAHATWAQSPTIDSWDTGPRSLAPRQYEYTPNFVWANTVQQAAAVCDDYFRWNDFLTGGGNDHTEGGWLDRNYYALALACSTGILNPTPYAYAAHWGMPGPVSERRQALVDAFGAAASPPFQAIENSEHRDTEVLLLYPISLVANDERFGSWMVQYGYANYVTADRLLHAARVSDDGLILMAGRRFTTVVALFEPVPPAGLLPFLETFAQRGGRIIWSGPPPRIDFAGHPIAERWQRLFGVRDFQFGAVGLPAPGERVGFSGPLASVPAQTILTHFPVDHLYPVTPAEGAQPVARWNDQVVGVHRPTGPGSSVTFLGFRPRDDQAASLGDEVRTWFEILRTLGAYPPSGPDLPTQDHPAVISRNGPCLSCRFPNGTVTLAAHLHRYVEAWPGGFHRDDAADTAILARHPLPSDRLDVDDLRVAGHRVTYRGRLTLAFRLNARNELIAFGGYDCLSITLNGTTTQFADQPLAFLAWAPVDPTRRVPDGAVAELWVQGSGTVRIPCPTDAAHPRLFLAGARPGARGAEVPLQVEDGDLRIVARPEWGRAHLFLTGSALK